MVILIFMGQVLIRVVLVLKYMGIQILCGYKTVII